MTPHLPGFVAMSSRLMTQQLRHTRQQVVLKCTRHTNFYFGYVCWIIMNNKQFEKIKIVEKLS